MINTISDFYDSKPAIAALPAGHSLLKEGEGQAKACLWWNFGSRRWCPLLPGELSGPFHFASGMLLARPHS